MGYVELLPGGVQVNKTESLYGPSAILKSITDSGGSMT